MSVNVTVNGSTYSIPQTSETGWGDSLTSWIQAISQSTLQKTGGSFLLTGELDLGATFGIKTAYVKSQNTNLASAGVVRLANADTVSWRNLVNGADLALKPSGTTDGVLSFDGVDLIGSSLTQTLTNKTINASSNTISNIVNANISASAAIAYSKLALTGSILNADLAGSIAYSKLILTGSVTNADLAGSIAYAKLVLTGSVTNADLAGSIAYSKLSLTGAILNADLAGSIAYSKLILTGSIVNADVSASAAISYSKLNLSSSIVNADVSASAAIAYSKLNLASSIVNADVSASAAIAYSKLNLTGAILNADLAGSIAYSKLVLTTSIVNGDIAAAAAIARTKIASGTADHVLINSGTGVMSSEATLAITRGGTGQATANAALNALLPSQGSNAGKYLTTNGTNSSWASATATAPNSEIYLQGWVGFGTTNTKIWRLGASPVRNIGSDLTLTDSAANGMSITVNTTGIYEVLAGGYNGSSYMVFGATVDSAQLTTDIDSCTTADVFLLLNAPAGAPVTASKCRYFTAGQVIRPHGNVTAPANTVYCRFIVTRVA